MFRRLLLALAVFAISGIANAAGRAELPIREVDLSDGARRYVVDVQIDGRMIEAGLDTGSTGLRVLARALGPAELNAHGRPVSYFYSSGTRFVGDAIPSSVTIGGTTGQIRLMRVDSIGCTREEPECPATHVNAANFGIQGDGLPGQGFAAILGIGLNPDPVANPLEQLGIRWWIVELPKPGSNNLGRLILNPDDAEARTYKRVALVGNGNQMPACLAAPSGRQPICGLGLFDSGAPGIHITSERPIQPWPQGTPASIVVGERSRQVAMPLTIGRRDEGSGMFVAIKAGAEPPRISFGIAPYFGWSVLYDASAREIGVRER